MLYMKKVFKRFFVNIAASFSGRNLVLHGMAILLTAALVFSGFDWWYFKSHQITAVQMFLFPAVVIGAFFPVIAPLVLYVTGKLFKQTRIVATAFAIIQAAILGSLISSTYKAFTGRIQPDLRDLSTDISHNFQFGFLKHGIFWGWPSSHTTIAFAMAFTIIFLNRGNRAVLCGALLYAFYIGIGISVSIHWFSDFAAGALIGSAIGMTVGKSYSDRNGLATQ